MGAKEPQLPIRVRNNLTNRSRQVLDDPGLICAAVLIPLLQKGRRVAYPRHPPNRDGGTPQGTDLFPGWRL